jgi:APA family basic amino acid/polyamine antiporter
VVWIITGLLTVTAALSYGELAAMMPKAGGQYVYLRESHGPLWGFLYGWTLFLVIQTGTIAAVAVAFARYLGQVWPVISPTHWIVAPIDFSKHYAVSFSTQQLVAVLLIAGLTVLNSFGLSLGKWIQNIFTSAKTLSLLALIVIGVTIGSSHEAITANFTHFWAIGPTEVIKPDLGFLPAVTASAGVFGLVIAVCVGQVGSLFSSDAWNNITFTAGEVKNPQRNIPLSLAAGTGLVIGLYLLANLAYLCMLPLSDIQHAPDDRVATAAIGHVFSGMGPLIMAVAIMVSTFGCNNGLILAGARVYYAMARDGLFFRATGRLNRQGVPAFGLALQCLWAIILVLPRIRLIDPATGQPKLNPASGMAEYGNLYSNLLDYVVFAVLLFYLLTIYGLFVLRRKRPEMERPYKAFGYPLFPIAYLVIAGTITLALLFYQTKTSLPGLAIVLAGVPIYFIWRAKAKTGPSLSKES